MTTPSIMMVTPTPKPIQKQFHGIPAAASQARIAVGVGQRPLVEGVHPPVKRLFPVGSFGFFKNVFLKFCDEVVKLIWSQAFGHVDLLYRMYCFAYLRT
jgi:hypothetical protein